MRQVLSLVLGLCLLIGFSAQVAADPAPANAERVFELRTYTAAPDKLDELHQRFRAHTLKFFERHGMVNIGYWSPTDASQANTIVYVLAHKSREAAKKSWADFNADPEWQKVKRASEANGALVTKVESIYMNATDYSPMR